MRRVVVATPRGEVISESPHGRGELHVFFCFFRFVTDTLAGVKTAYTKDRITLEMREQGREKETELERERERERERKSESERTF